MSLPLSKILHDMFDWTPAIIQNLICRCWTPYSKLLKDNIALVRKELSFCYKENLLYFINYSFLFLLFTGIYNSLIAFFHCLNLADKVHVDVKETKAMVEEIHQVIKRPDNRQSSSITTGDRNGRSYFSLILWTFSTPRL